MIAWASAADAYHGDPKGKHRHYRTRTLCASASRLCARYLCVPSDPHFRAGRNPSVNVSRAAFTDPARLPPCFDVLLSELSIEIWTISPKGHSLSGRKRELHLEAVYGGGFAATRLRAMELITILNRCYRFRGFVYGPNNPEYRDHLCRVYALLSFSCLRSPRSDRKSVV